MMNTLFSQKNLTHDRLTNRDNLIIDYWYSHYRIFKKLHKEICE
jgi:hypothetical protein